MFSITHLMPPDCADLGLAAPCSRMAVFYLVTSFSMYVFFQDVVAASAMIAIWVTVENALHSAVEVDTTLIYSALGLATGWFVVRFAHLHKFVPQLSTDHKDLFLKYFVQFLFLLAIFLPVDHYTFPLVPNTAFPIGLAQSFVAFLTFATVLYYVNRNDRDIRVVWHSLDEYNRAYLHWIAVCCAFFLAFTRLYASTLVMASLASGSIALLYALVYTWAGPPSFVHHGTATKALL